MVQVASLAPPAATGVGRQKKSTGTRPDDSPFGSIATGLLILAVFFGGFGAWAAMAPLNAAVMGDAVVKVEGNRKSLQHLDGGTVKEILVHEGDHVAANDVVMVLDDTQIRAEVDILRQQQVQLLATEARLRAEFDGQPSFGLPQSLTGSEDEALVKAALADQQDEFDSRRNAMQAQQSVLQQRIAQYREQIAGLEAQAAPLEAQVASIGEEKASLKKLLADGLTTRTRMLDLERRENDLAGRKAEIRGNIASAQEAISELEQQGQQLDKDRFAEIAGQLRETRAKLLDIEPRLRASAVGLARTAVRTPYAGKVVDLAVFSVGAVVAPGERLMDIVPDDTSLVVEAKIRVEDIAEVRPDMRAEVHFTSYKQRTIPLIHGTVSEISADRLTDPRTQVPYYVIRVDVDDKELAASPEIQLYPGMPATVMVTTRERTALDYMLGPLTASLDRAFREK